MAEEMGLDFHGSDCTRTADFVTLAPVVGLECLIHQKEAKILFPLPAPGLLTLSFILGVGPFPFFYPSFNSCASPSFVIGVFYGKARS